MGADGIKTGFLSVEKYSLAASAKLNERRINVVGSGYETKNSRSRESIKIINWGLRTFDTINVAKKNEVIENLNVWLGKKNKVAATIKKDIYLTIPKRKKRSIKAVIEYDSPILAPIKKGDIIGTLKVFIKNDLKEEVDLIANEDVKKANIFSRLFKSLNYLVWGDV